MEKRSTARIRRLSRGSSSGTGRVRRAYEAGKRYGYSYRRHKEEFTGVQAALAHFWRKWRSDGHRRLSYRSHAAISSGFSKGFFRGAREKGAMTLLPTRAKVGVIISAHGESKRVKTVLDELKHLALDEIIVVMHGPSDKMFRKIRRHASSPIIVSYPESFGHDVGRALGAKLSKSDILLFVDAEKRVGARSLLPFIDAVSHRADVALNDISRYLPHFRKRDPVFVAAEFLNRSLGKPKLSVNSMAVLPFALTRKAVETIGYRTLVVPPLAQARAIHKGLLVTAPAGVSRFAGKRGYRNAEADRMLGDHLEALHEVMKKKGERLEFPDPLRKRSYARGNG